MASGAPVVVEIGVPRRLSWLGEPGDTGFFRYYPHFLGSDHARQVEAAIDREVHKEYFRLKHRPDRARARRKRRRKSRSA